MKKHTISELTERERQVAELLAWGASKKEIPDLLARSDGKRPISVDTVRVITQNIFRKWEVQKVNELSAMWFCLNFHIPVSAGPFARKVIAAVFLALTVPSILNNSDVIRQLRISGRYGRFSPRSSRRNDTYYQISA